MSWLVLAGRLSSGFSDELGSAFRPTFCAVSDMGFSDSAHGAITDRPPRPSTVPYDNWCNERSLIVRLDDTVRTVGCADICEGLVYDERYRVDIDFTGVKVTIALRGDAYEDYVRYVGEAKVPDLADNLSWAGGIVFRVPSPRFVFPMPRGSSRPWGNENVVGKLKQVKRFNFDYIEVQQLCAKSSQRVTLETESCPEQADLKPALCMGELSDSLR
jgi:hypothetical protein